MIVLSQFVGPSWRPGERAVHLGSVGSTEGSRAGPCTVGVCPDKDRSMTLRRFSSKGKSVMVYGNIVILVIVILLISVGACSLLLV